MTANDPQAIRRLQVFSLSLYLRGLIASNQSLTISVDRIREKMSLIQEFFGEIPDLLGVSLTDDRSILLVSISSSWVSDHNRLPEMLWPCARGWWRCSPERTYAIRHLVAVDENHVVGIWAVTGAKRGHELIMRGDYSSTRMGSGQAVQRDFSSGVNIGASDPRKDGAAVGY